MELFGRMFIKPESEQLGPPWLNIFNKNNGFL